MLRQSNRKVGGVSPHGIRQDEDQKLSALPCMVGVRQHHHLLSTVPAGIIADKALPHFLGLDGESVKETPTAEEWVTICDLALARIDPTTLQDAAVAQSPDFQAFCTTIACKHDDPHALPRYLTLYLPADRCPLHAFWPRRHAQDVIDRALYDKLDRFLGDHPLPDAALVRHIGAALRQTRLVV